MKCSEALFTFAALTGRKHVQHINKKILHQHNRNGWSLKDHS